MSPDQPPEVQREEILNAAMACFNEYGYDATTFDAIAARSGLAATTVSVHFADKSEIRSSLFAMWSERLSAWLTNA
jgi:AcrR family transcriptional regulator